MILFYILNYCILNGKFYIHKYKLFHENALDFYDYLCELKYKLQIERIKAHGPCNMIYVFNFVCSTHIC